MHQRRIAATAAFLIVSAALAPAAARADTPAGSTLYVNQSSDCSDSAGSGSAAVPFCSIGAAVDAAAPGQTVYIQPGSYPSVQITRSGTATAPIHIIGAPDYRGGSFHDAWIGYQAAAVSLTVSDSSYLEFENIGVETGKTGTVVISGSSDIIFDSTTFGFALSVAAPLLEITGSSQAVTVERSFLTGSHPSAVVVDGGSTNTVISTDDLGSTEAATVALDDAPGAVVTGNSLLTSCQGSLSLGADSTGAVIENNVLTDTSDSCPNGAPALFSVDPAASPTTTEDYNSLGVTGMQPYYDWDGTDFASIAKFSSATGQGGHDLVYGNSVIDSANSAAPGELFTDVLGHPRIDVPTVKNTGAGPESYFDRGAFENPGPLPSATFTASARQAPIGSPVFFTATGFTGLADGLTYDFDFGDGTTQTTTTDSVSHSYTQADSYSTAVTVSSVTGVIKKLTGQLTVVPPAPLAAAMSVNSAGTMTAVVANQSTGAWDVTGYTVDFGDGTEPMQAVAGTPRLVHSYAKLGTYAIKLTATDSHGDTATTARQFTTAGSEYTAYGPVRVLDTRHGTGTGGVTAPLGPNATLHLKIADNGTIPADVSAVALNLTVTDPSGGGYVTAFPGGQARPTTSNLNYTPGLTKATSVLVGVGSDGGIDLYNGSSGTADLVADVTGYFTASTASGYTPLYPARILDTRKGTGTGAAASTLAAGSTLTLTVAGADSGSLPADGIKAVALNLTATDTATGGYVTAWPDGTTKPLASSLNFPGGQTVPNAVIVPVGADGKIDLYNGSGGTIDLVADVQGYFSAGGADAYLPVTPTRLYDSRTSGGPVSDNSGPYLQPLGPSPAINGTLSTVAFVYNVTVTQPTGAGNAVVYPADWTPPLASNVNFDAGQTTANTAIALTAANAAPDNSLTVRLYSPGAETQLIVDLFGYFSAE